MPAEVGAAKLLERLLGLCRWLLRVPSLQVRIFEDEPKTGGLKFEVENATSTMTSLAPEIRCSFHHPVNGIRGRWRRTRAYFDVREVDCQLPPFTPRTLSASGRDLDPQYPYSWFRVYRFKPRRGVPRRVRLRAADLVPLSRRRFIYELWRYRIFSKLHKSGAMSIDQYQAMKRSQGPH